MTSVILDTLSKVPEPYRKIRASVRATLRSLHLTWHLFWGLLKALLLKNRYGENWHQTTPGKQAILAWMRRLCRIMGLRVTAMGKPTSAPVMLAANHVSWLDIIAIGSLTPVRFLAKSDVRSWPIIGALARLTGTLFIQRHSHKAAHETQQYLAQTLSNQETIVIFPEGTTTNGHNMQAFKPALFEASRLANCLIQPVAIRYWRNNVLDPIAPYIDDDAFVTHLWRVMRAKQTKVNIHFCPTLQSTAPRRTLATLCQQVIQTELESNYPEMTNTQETPAIKGVDDNAVEDNVQAA